MAKSNRRVMTEAERKLWQFLRRNITGLKFKRQQQIGSYIADFVCLEKRIIVECDGGQHAKENIDKERDAYLNNRGFKVLRFWNTDILQNIEGVWIVIKKEIDK